jgi:uncharacterized integral membrane protein
MLRKIVSALILLPLALILFVFALANRQWVTVSFDPIQPADPSLSVTLPLFAVLAVTGILGVMFGSMLTWFRQGKFRRAARLNESIARDSEATTRELRERLADTEAQIAAFGALDAGDPRLPRRLPPAA